MSEKRTKLIRSVWLAKLDDLYRHDINEYDYGCYGMARMTDGEYLLREDVKKLIEEILSANAKDKERHE